MTSFISPFSMTWAIMEMSKKTNKFFLILISFCLIDPGKCDIKAQVTNRVKKLEERSRRLYGDAQRRPLKQWELNAENPTSYPNGDKQKLAAISHAWTTYYRCSLTAVNSITSSGRLPSLNVAVYEGEIARLPCGLCVAPGERDRVDWFYSQVTVYYMRYSVDKQKLAAISHAWTTYYRCSSAAVNSITPSGRLPSLNVAVYEGEIARLPCGLCVAPGERDRVDWFYSQSTHNVSFKRLNARSTMILNVNLTIYNVQKHDTGLYRCRLASSVGGPVDLHVLNDDYYRVIDATSNHGPESAMRATSSSDLISFISWSPWSECSACGRKGMRRRYGLCYVHLNNSKLSVTGKISSSIFQEFPYGIACRSRLLPAAYRNDPAIADRNNIIMTESCETPCKQVFEVRSASGAVLERASNSAGVFSLCQNAPPQPPPPARDIVFVEYGDPVTLMCPGTTLRDIPITWRKGTKFLSVGALARQTANRVRLNARDQIVFAFVEDGDADVYSCWQSSALAGVVKLEVRRAAWRACGRPAVVASLLVLAVALHYAARVLRSKLRHTP